MSILALFWIILFRPYGSKIYVDHGWRQIITKAIVWLVLCVWSVDGYGFANQDLWAQFSPDRMKEREEEEEKERKIFDFF